MHRASGQAGFVDQMIGVGKSRSDQFFDKIDAAVDWSPLEEKLSEIYSSKTGRPSHPPLMLFKVLLLQRWYQLSDPAAEDAINDRKSFARFIGLPLDRAAPDHSVISRFRSQLTRLGLMQPLLDDLAAQIDAKGLILKEGTLLDATLVGSAARPPSAPRKTKAGAPAPKAPSDPYRAGKLSRVDPDARWARKGSKARFGYKLHIAADKEHVFVRAHRVTAANVNDCELGPALVRPDGGAHYADKGYSSRPIRQRLKQLNLADGVMKLGNKHHALAAAERRRNRVLATLRAPVETVFAQIKHGFSMQRSRYFGLEKVRTDCDLAVFCYNLKRFAALSQVV